MDKAKIMIVKDFLASQLAYEPDKLEKIQIKETRMATKGENIIYVALEEQSEVKEVYLRKAELKNDEVTVCNYIPPNFYSRFTYLNTVCREMREQDKSLKTQLRFGKDDIEIFTKNKGEEAPYKQVRIEDITDITAVPLFDHSIRWRKFEDKPPRRKLTEHSTGKTTTQGGPGTREKRSGIPVAQSRVNPLIRQHSLNKEDEETKKKTKLSTSSSEADDMEESDSSDESADSPSGRKDRIQQ